MCTTTRMKGHDDMRFSFKLGTFLGLITAWGLTWPARLAICKPLWLAFDSIAWDSGDNHLLVPTDQSIKDSVKT